MASRRDGPFPEGMRLASELAGGHSILLDQPEAVVEVTLNHIRKSS